MNWQQCAAGFDYMLLTTWAVITGSDAQWGQAQLVLTAAVDDSQWVPAWQVANTQVGLVVQYGVWVTVLPQVFSNCLLSCAGQACSVLCPTTAQSNIVVGDIDTLTIGCVLWCQWFGSSR